VRTFFKSAMTSRASEKRQQAKAADKAWRIMRRLVLERDDYRCRACDRRQESLDVHHIRARSLGGKHTDSGCCALCLECHADIKLGKLHITGDANGKLSISRT